MGSIVKLPKAGVSLSQSEMKEPGTQELKFAWGKGKETKQLHVSGLSVSCQSFYLDYCIITPLPVIKKKKNHHDCYSEAYITASNLP